MADVLDLLGISISSDAGFPRLTCEVDPSQIEEAASSLAATIAGRRLGVNPRLHELWTKNHSGKAGSPPDADIKLLKATLLENIGTPDDPADTSHLNGLIAEAVWIEVIKAIDTGLGVPVRVEGHDWSVTDPGGDGLTVYATPEGFCFRLWESKHHGAATPVRETANFACRQLQKRSLSYLARFSLIAQDLAHDGQLAIFYGLLPEMWVNKDPAAGIGINVTAGSDADIEGDFGNITSYFELDSPQHQATLHLMSDAVIFADTVRHEIWKGCGLSTEH